jgi:hypothetical protein
MTLDSRFTLLHSEFNAFLFATIGEERNGVELTLISALTRLGMDPWKEAERLARLPRRAAGAALAEILVLFPSAAWGAAETRPIADRLVELLPDPRTARLHHAQANAAQAGGWLRAAALILLILAVAVAFLKS